jgi:hypothetical protein
MWVVAYLNWLELVRKTTEAKNGTGKIKDFEPHFIGKQIKWEYTK